MKLSGLSRLLLTGVAAVSLSGWLGVRLSPLAGGVLAAQVDPADTAQPSVRNRAAWQPSPIPMGQQPAAVAMAGVMPSVALPRQAAANAPANAPASAGQAAPALGGAPIQVNAAGVVPYDALFTHDRLEAMYNGGLPDTRGTWVEEHFFSRALNQDVAYMAWLPPGYDADSRTYPTLYLLHGAGGPDGYGVEEWLGYALTEDLDRMLAAGLIQPMIVILPNGEQGYWMNQADGGPKWADFVAQDLVKHVDATLRTDPTRERRAIGGLSMGGHGALQLALNHPDEFSIVGAHSPTLRSYQDSPDFFGDPSWFAKYDPLSLVRSSTAASKLTIWIDSGSTDQWRPALEPLVQALTAKNAAVQYHVLEGEHQGWYWKEYLPQYLDFYSSALYATSETRQGAPVVAPALLSSTGSVSALS